MGINNSKDVLKEKQKDLASYQKKFDDAVSVVTNAAHNLEKINGQIEEKINEIDEYQESLSRARDDLDKARGRNAQVIKNFNALLGVGCE